MSVAPNKHYHRQESRFLTGAAMDRLTAELGLAKVGQDWDLEAADARRVAEFLDYYDAQPLNDDEHFALMALIVASFDDRLATGPDEVLQDRIVARLSARFDILNYLVQYWALPDEEDVANSFRFTPISRQVMQSQYGDREHWPRTPFALMRATKLLPEQGVIDSLDIVDNRDGVFELSWSKIAGRDRGSHEFASVEEATEFARCHFGIAANDWCVFE